jgi:hypothetical protein
MKIFKKTSANWPTNMVVRSGCFTFSYAMNSFVEASKIVREIIHSDMNFICYLVIKTESTTILKASPMSMNTSMPNLSPTRTYSAEQIANKFEKAAQTDTQSSAIQSATPNDDHG